MIDRKGREKMRLILWKILNIKSDIIFSLMGFWISWDSSIYTKRYERADYNKCSRKVEKNNCLKIKTNKIHIHLTLIVSCWGKELECRLCDWVGFGQKGFAEGAMVSGRYSEWRRGQKQSYDIKDRCVTALQVVLCNYPSMPIWPT